MSAQARSVAGIAVNFGGRWGLLACPFEAIARMDRHRADPRLIWLASVLAAATFVIFLTHAA
jgi:ABC-type Co2+ transport system permease subunit